MLRVVLFLLSVLALAAGLAWLADRPGTLLVTWQDYEIETSVFRAVVIFAGVFGVALLIWSLMRQIWSGPAAFSHFLTKRRQRRGLDALSAGMIAIGAGDRAMAARYALQARKSLPNEPLTHLLRAQAAQLSGDKTTARRIFEAMLATPDTEQLGLRGLFLEAGREHEHEAQRQFAERALRLNPKLSWPSEALFGLQCKVGDWAGAQATLASARRNGHIDRPTADRRRAVLLTAEAQALEDSDPEKALNLSLEAHGLAPSLIPAAAIAGRLLASRGNTPRAAKIIQKTWAKSPQPELATAYAYARIGDSPRDRLDRVRQLAALNPYSIESPIAVAIAAIEAHEYAEARNALAPYLENGLTRRIASLMARIEAEEHGDKGRVREWLARAVNAPRDPAWTADGVVAERWMPASPVTGALDAFEWRVPVAEIEPGEHSMLGHELDDLIALGEPAAADAETIVTQAGEPAPPARFQGRAAETIDADDAVSAVDEAASSQSKQAPARPGDGRTARQNAIPLPEPMSQAARGATKTTRPPGSVPPKPNAEAPVADAGGSQAPRKPAPSRTETPRIFTAPPPPDDPGTEADDPNDAGSPLRPLGV
jgi:HemY protein